MTAPTPPGWYPNPAGGFGNHYWDGQKWSLSGPAKARRRLVWPWVLIGTVVLVFFAGAAAHLKVTTPAHRK